MLKSLLTLTALTLSGLASAATTLTDGSFETQGAASTTNYCYFGQATPGGPACGNAPWLGAGAGLQIETNTPWPGQQVGNDGSYYGFVQGTGLLGQLFTADTGSYTLSWLDAGRPSGVAGGDQTYDVRLLTITGPESFTALTLGSFATTTNQVFTGRSVSGVALAAGQNYALVFEGTNRNGGDQTAFIDKVSLDAAAAVPEPATWAMLMLGFGLVGAAARRRKGVAAVA